MNKSIESQINKEHRLQEIKYAIKGMVKDGGNSKKIVEVLKWQFDITMEQLVDVIISIEDDLTSVYEEMAGENI